MCETCGGHQNDESQVRQRDSRAEISLTRALLSANDRRAAHNASHLDRYGILAVNLMSSPGSGKTSLLEATIDLLKKEFRLAVIEGDLATENDADRIRAHGVPAVQITTGAACHLDAGMIHDALHQFDLSKIDILFIENVGNLVCPAGFQLGQHEDVALLSVVEGDDKPAKYPTMFRQVDMVLLSKSDLAPFVEEFDLGRATANIRALGNAAPVLSISAKNGAGLEAWADWLRAARAGRAARLDARPAPTARLETISARP